MEQAKKHPTGRAFLLNLFLYLLLICFLGVFLIPEYWHRHGAPFSMLGFETEADRQMSEELDEILAEVEAEHDEEAAYYDRPAKPLPRKTLHAALAVYPLEYDRLSRQGREREEPSFDLDLEVQAAVEKRLRLREGYLEPALNHFVAELRDEEDCTALEYAYGSFYYREWASAEDHALRAVEEAKGDAAGRNKLVDAYLLAGWSAAQQGELYRARRHFDNARKRVHPGRDFNRWTLVQLLTGELKNEQQLYAEAEKDLKALVGQLYRRQDFTNPRLHEGWRLLSVSLMRQGKYPEAIKHLRAQHKLVVAKYSRRHPMALRNRDAAIYAHIQQGQYAEAVTLAEELIGLKKQIPGAAAGSVLLTRAQRAQALTRAGRHADAVAELSELLPLLADQYGEESKPWLEAMGTQALALEGLGRQVEAERVYRRIISQSKNQHGEEDPLTLTLNLGLAELLANLGRKEEARDLTLRVLRLRQKVLGRGHPATAEAEQALRNISSL